MTFKSVHATRAFAPGAAAPRHAIGIQWWEPVLPARIWRSAGRYAARTAHRLIDRGQPAPRRVRVAMRLSARMSRAAFNSCLFWTGIPG